MRGSESVVSKSRRHHGPHPLLPELATEQPVLVPETEPKPASQSRSLAPGAARCRSRSPNREPAPQQPSSPLCCFPQRDAEAQS